jgi:tetratricopeptide (TPR) repeat protein
VAALAERADSVMRLTPLRKAEVERLINAMVMLDERARAALVRQSNGNPMFALQWLKSAILQGMVRETPAGYTIADGIAADLKGLWRQRVELALRDDRSGAARAALLSGAVLGVDVELDTWRALAMRLGSDPVNFLPWMVQLGLAEYAPDGWRFATPQLRAQLCEAARQAGIWKSLNAAAAQVLTRAARVDHWRVGNHQVEAAESAAAIDSFMLAAEDLLLSGEFERVEAALERRDALMDRLRVDAKDERRGAALRCRASNFYRRGQRDEFREFARKGMVLAVQMGWSVVHAELMVALCESQILSGEIDEVFRQMPEALEVLERAGNVVRLSEAHRVYAAALVASGRMDDALPHLDLATSLARRCEDPNMLATAFWERGDYLRSLADYEGARQAFSGALEIYEGLGARVGCGWAHNALGDLSRLLGEFAQAAHHLNKAHELFKGVGAREVIGVEANLAMLALARGDWDDAVERFEVCYRETTADGAHFYRMLSVLGMVAGEMCRGAVGEAMRWMALYEELASQANYFDPDLLTLSTLARDRVPSGLADFRTRLDAVVSAQQPDR